MATIDQIKTSINSGEMDAARALLRSEIAKYPTTEIYYLAATVAVSKFQQVNFLKKALELNPQNQEAMQALEQLDAAEEDTEYRTLTRSRTTVFPTDSYKKTKNDEGQTYYYAGFGDRVSALILDGVFVRIIQLVATFFLGVFIPTPRLGSSSYEAEISFLAIVVLLVQFAISFIYYVVIFTYNDGQTFGKKICGIRVMKTSGRPLTMGEAFVRNYIGYFISALVLGIGFLVALGDKQHQTWHDKLVDTVVVKD